MPLTQLDIFVHAHERSCTQAHLDENRKRFGRQCQQVYDALVKYGEEGITSETIDVKRIKRVASRIDDLKRLGVQIDNTGWRRIGDTKFRVYKLKQN